jgi:hypothetical protein
MAKKRQSKDASRWVAKTRAEVAKVLGVGERQVAQYLADGCPGEQGAYSLPEIIAWCKSHAWKPRRAAAINSDDAAELELRQLQVKVERETLKLRTEAGELINRDSVLAAVEQIFVRVKNRVEAIPEELAAQLPANIRVEQLSAWKQKLALVLKEMEGWAP